MRRGRLFNLPLMSQGVADTPPATHAASLQRMVRSPLTTHSMPLYPFSVCPRLTDICRLLDVTCDVLRTLHRYLSLPPRVQLAFDWSCNYYNFPADEMPSGTLRRMRWTRACCSKRQEKQRESHRFVCFVRGRAILRALTLRWRRIIQFCVAVIGTVLVPKRTAWRGRRNLAK